MRKVTAAGEVITLATGGLLNGRDSSVHNSITPNPLSFLAVDRLNFVYVADLSIARLLRVSPGGETVLIGGADAPSPTTGRRSPNTTASWASRSRK